MKKDSPYELLRIISTIAVISNHVSTNYILAITSSTWLGTLYSDHIFVSYLYNTLPLFSIRCFIMLSGAFDLDNKRNREFKSYYGRIFKSIGIPLIIFSTAYFLYSLLIAVLAVLVHGKKITHLLGPVENLLTGKPYYHLWYLFMMIGIYALTPVVIRLKQEIGERFFAGIAVIFFPIATLSLWTSEHYLMWDVGLSFCYLGYYMLGYVIRKKFMDRKNNRKAYLLIGMGVFLEILIAYGNCHHGLMEWLNCLTKYNLLDYLLTEAACVLIFAGFSMMQIKHVFNRLSTVALTWNIYLFHAGIWSLLQRGITAEMDSRVVIPVSVFLVLVLSVLASNLYKTVWVAVTAKRK